MRAVYELLGEVVHPDQPLMAVGLDSRGAMELRNTLQEQLGLDVPNTLLYDAQTINQAVIYLDRLLMEYNSGGDSGAGSSAGGQRSVHTSENVAAAAQPSFGLLKTLRYDVC